MGITIGRGLQGGNFQAMTDWWIRNIIPFVLSPIVQRRCGGGRGRGRGRGGREEEEEEEEEHKEEEERNTWRVLRNRPPPSTLPKTMPSPSPTLGSSDMKSTWSRDVTTVLPIPSSFLLLP
jgi:hypothetical protein